MKQRHKQPFAYEISVLGLIFGAEEWDLIVEGMYRFTLQIIQHFEMVSRLSTNSLRTLSFFDDCAHLVFYIPWAAMANQHIAFADRNKTI